MTAIPHAPQRLRPPAGLSGLEREIFAQVVGSLPITHFLPSDLQLVVEYATACALARDASRHLIEEGAVINNRVSPWLIVQEKSTRAMAALATKLRLSPQSRARTKVKAAPPLSYFERQRLQQLEDVDDAAH